MSLPLHHSILNTDLYQLTMAAGYFVHDMHPQASFELYVRRLPHQRQFLVAAGLEQALDYLENLHFEAEEVDWLRSHPAFQAVPEAFFDYLRSFRFEGQVDALPEGSVFFPYEPLLRVTAPLIQAQLVETWLLAMINYQTSVASKAARIRMMLESLNPRVVFSDFGSRRAHGPEASLLAARAAFIGGAVSTSNVYAGQHLNIPVVGTAAHSWTMAFENEQAAFKAYRKVFPEHSTLLVDTYDTLQGIEHAIASGQHLQGIRLDSGDFLALSKAARARLDAAGFKDTNIVVSGDMNEYKIRELLAAGAPIDIFGVGTELATSLDAPSLGGVYKLVETRQGEHCHYALKLSGSKISYPGRKQVWRDMSFSGQMLGDTLGLADEVHPGIPLLKTVMQAGKRLRPSPSLLELQAHFLNQLKALPASLKHLSDADYPLHKTPGLEKLFAQLRHQTLEENQ